MSDRPGAWLHQDIIVADAFQPIQQARQRRPRLSRTARAGDTDESAERDFDVDILEIVVARTDNANHGTRVGEPTSCGYFDLSLAR